MEIIYRELRGFKEFNECVQLQEKIFNLSDLDKISPLILNLLAGDDVPCGMLLGAFIKTNNVEKMIGFVAVMSTLLEKSVYGLIIGILPEYQRKPYGLGLMKKLYEVCVNRGIDSLFGKYEALESNIGRFYLNMLGFTGYKYEMQASELSESSPVSEIPVDRILVRWDMKTNRVVERVSGNYPSFKIEELISLYPVATSKNLVYPDKVLLEIPVNYPSLAVNNIKVAYNWQMQIRELFTEYLNNYNYMVCECVKGLYQGQKKCFYILEKQL